MTPLFEHLEGAHITPVDPIVSDVLRNFDVDGVHKVWIKALERRHADPEGAITSARTLLETVCKRVLERLKRSTMKRMIYRTFIRRWRRN